MTPQPAASNQRTITLTVGLMTIYHVSGAVYETTQYATSPVGISFSYARDGEEEMAWFIPWQSIASYSLELDTTPKPAPSRSPAPVGGLG